MKFRLPTKLAFLIILLVAIAATSIHPTAAPVKAQGGLSEEQLALLERIVNAISVVDDYTSYVNTESSTLALNGSVALAGFTQEIVQSQQLDKTTTYVLGDNPNALVVATYTSETNQEGGTIASYTVDAEARYVDGVLYVNITPVDGDVSELALPEGWVEVEDVTTYEIFDDIGLDRILERVGAIEANPANDSPLKDLELLEKIVQDVTVEETTLEDGSTVNVFTLTIDFVDLISEAPDAFGGDSNSAAQGLFNAFEGQSVEATIILDAEDNPLAYALSFEGELVDLDASVLSSSLAGATLNLSFVFSQTSELSQVNEAIEPVAAPE